MRQDNTNVCGWDIVIASTLKQLQELEGMAAKLKFARDYFQEQKRNGEPFPGEGKLKNDGLLS